MERCFLSTNPNPKDKIVIIKLIYFDYPKLPEIDMIKDLFRWTK